MSNAETEDEPRDNISFGASPSRENTERKLSLTLRHTPLAKAVKVKYTTAPTKNSTAQTQIGTKQEPATTQTTTMASERLLYDKFVYGHDSSTIGTRWEQWLEGYELYLIATDLDKSNASTKANFQVMIGREALNVLKTLKRKDSDGSETLDQLAALLTKHFVGERSVFTERNTFRRATKGRDESIDEFHRRLRGLAEYCKYEEGLEAEILQQLVSGCEMEQFQMKACRTLNLTLADALTTARGYERNVENFNGLKKPTTREQGGSINNLTSGARNGYGKPKANTQYDTCGNCGGSPHESMRNCPAQGKECYNCKALNHYGRVCRKAPTKHTQAHQSNNGYQRYNGSQRNNGGQHNNGNQRYNGNQRNNRNQINSSQRKHGSQVNTVTEEQPGTMVIDAKEYAELMRLKQTLDTDNVYSLTNKCPKEARKAPRATLDILGQPVTWLIDTGSPVNIIHEGIFDTLNPKPRLDRCNTTYYAFRTNTPIPIVGQFCSEIRSRNYVVKVAILVVRGKSECLLSFNTALDLNLIKMVNGIEETTATPPQAVTATKTFPLRTMEAVIKQFPKLFQDEIGCLKDVSVTLDIDESVRPVRQPQRPIAFHLRNAVEKELRKQLAEDIIEPVNQTSGPTPWIANLVIVPKAKPPPNTKTSSCRPTRPDWAKEENTTIEVRLTTDSRAQNNAIQRTRYPSKTMDDLIYLTNGARFFSVLDIRKAFHQILLAPESRNHTTFTTHMGLFRYKRLHMGISCASEIFTEEIRKLLAHCAGQVNMTDDIMIFGHTQEEHDARLMETLKTLESNGLTLNSGKCKLFKEKVTYFGIEFSKDGVAPTEDRCRALREASEPKNSKELLSILGVGGYSSRFMRNHQAITAPLRRLTRKDVPWKWTEVEADAFKAFKNAIKTYCMAYFNTKWHTELTVDASPDGLSAVLAQINPEDPEDRRFVVFASRQLTDVERRYSQCEKEALAAVWGCERLWVYLFGKKFTLITDNRAVQLIFGNVSSRPPARIERWALRLTKFDYNIKHRPGLSNIADYFSRHPDKTVDLAALAVQQSAERYINAIVGSAIPSMLTMPQIAQATINDPELQDLARFVTAVNNRRRKDAPASLQQYSNIVDEINLDPRGIILRGQRILIPNTLRKRTVQLAHMGHQGIVKTKELIRALVWFPGIDAMVEDAVARCPACQATTTKPSYTPLNPTPMPEGPWQEVAGDFFGPMEDSTYFFVNIDKYSRWAAVKSLPTVAGCQTIPYLKELFADKGVPAIYTTDNGAPFQSKEFADFAEQWGFAHRRITPYWPRANGEAERFMKSLGKIIKTAKMTNTNKQDALQCFLRTYRETPHSTTKVAPNHLLYGYSHTAGIPTVQPSPEDIGHIHRMARENDFKAKARMKEEYDHRMKVRELQITTGTKVLIKLKRVDKTTPAWDPVPYVVVAVKGDMVTATRDGYTTTRNSSFFKRFLEAGFEDTDHEDTDHKEADQLPDELPDQQQQDQRTDKTPEVTKPVQALTAPTEAPAAPVEPEGRKQRGRPNKEQHAANQAARKQAETARRMANPATRTMPDRTKPLP